jgi:signal transduction histidine kinase
MRAMLRKGEAEFLPLDLNLLVGEVLGIMRSELVVRKVATATQLARDLPLVWGDRIQIQQVLLNLIMNACEAMSANPAADLRLRIKTEPVGADQVQAEVTDCGPGFAPEMLERIFEPFHTTKPNGLGLGLPICRSIISAHGGRVWVSNNRTGGATVHFTLAAHRRETL